MNAPRTAATWARLAWLTTTGMLAVALVLNAGGNLRGARAAVAGLHRGQADQLGAALWEMFSTSSAESDSARLARFFDANDHRGLRYVGFIDDRGRSAMRAGEAISEDPPPPRDSPHGRIPLIEMDGRVRAYFPAPPLVAGALASHLAIEFEPNAAPRLLRRARRSFLLACVGAGALSIAAWVFLRISVRYQGARLRLEEQRRLTMLGEMSAVLAHEIRNPLASLKGHAQLAAERPIEDTRARRCIEHVITEADRLDALTSDLLSFARSGPLELTAADPASLMRVAVHDVYGSDPPVIDAAHAPARWPMDAGRVRQALVNLLDNARQASPTDRPPRVRVARESNRLAFEVRDFGAGLDAGIEERIFDPFFTTRTSGTGLGLAVAKRVAELHGGDITATNHADGGAVFRLSLPRSAS